MKADTTKIGSDLMIIKGRVNKIIQDAKNELKEKQRREAEAKAIADDLEYRHQAKTVIDDIPLRAEENVKAGTFEFGIYEEQNLEHLHKGKIISGPGLYIIEACKEMDFVVATRADDTYDTHCVEITLSFK